MKAGEGAAVAFNDSTDTLPLTLRGYIIRCLHNAFTPDEVKAVFQRAYTFPVSAPTKKIEALLIEPACISASEGKTTRRSAVWQIEEGQWITFQDRPLFMDTRGVVVMGPDHLLGQPILNTRSSEPELIPDVDADLTAWKDADWQKASDDIKQVTGQSISVPALKDVLPIVVNRGEPADAQLDLRQRIAHQCGLLYSHSLINAVARVFGQPAL